MKIKSLLLMNSILFAIFKWPGCEEKPASPDPKTGAETIFPQRKTYTVNEGQPYADAIYAQY